MSLVVAVNVIGLPAAVVPIGIGIGMPQAAQLMIPASERSSALMPLLQSKRKPER